MNLIRIDEEIRDFSERIINTLKLEYHREGMLASQKRLCSWIRDESVRLRKAELNKAGEEVGALGRLARKVLGRETQKEVDPLGVDLNLLG